MQPQVKYYNLVKFLINKTKIQHVQSAYESKRFIVVLALYCELFKLAAITI